MISKLTESDTDTEGTRTQVDAESTSSSTADSSFQTRLFGFVSNIKGHFSKMLGERGFSGAEKVLETDKPNKLFEEICVPVANSPYLSPYCASDDELKKFPPTKILVSKSGNVE